jgi:hypothetical protein
VNDAGVELQAQFGGAPTADSRGHERAFHAPAGLAPAQRRNQAFGAKGDATIGAMPDGAVHHVVPAVLGYGRGLFHEHGLLQNSRLTATYDVGTKE